MISITTSAHAANASRLYGPIRENTFAGSPKIPAPMIPLIVIATRSQRRMPRTKPAGVGFAMRCKVAQTSVCVSLIIVRLDLISRVAVFGFRRGATADLRPAFQGRDRKRVVCSSRERRVMAFVQSSFTRRSRHHRAPRPWKAGLRSTVAPWRYALIIQLPTNLSLNLLRGGKVDITLSVLSQLVDLTIACNSVDGCRSSGARCL